MSIKEQIGDLLEEYHKLRAKQYEPDFLETYANIDLMINELRQTLEEREDYESN